MTLKKFFNETWTGITLTAMVVTSAMFAAIGSLTFGIYFYPITTAVLTGIAAAVFLIVMDIRDWRNSR